MSSSTSSLSTLTTVPVTMSPSSKATMVPEMASSNDMSPKSSLTTCLGVYSPVAASKLPMTSAKSLVATSVIESVPGASLAGSRVVVAEVSLV